VDEKGNELIGNNVEGRLCVKFPWPSMIRTIWGDNERFVNSYFSTAKKDNKPVYFIILIIYHQPRKIIKL